VACALARSADVGVDAEATSRAAPLGVVQRCFAHPERSALLALPAEQQPELFFEYWTLKEAFLKATGRGLSYPMERILFRLAPGHPPRVELPKGLGESADAWQFGSWRVEERYRIALAVRSGGVERRVKIRCWRAPTLQERPTPAASARPPRRGSPP
jgi:4'-phosphopantetheinyl transferase